MSDSRSAAWLGAWERVEAAQKLKTDPKGAAIEPLPEWYWSLLAEAQILAELAKAPMEVGFSVGDWLEERDRREREQREHIEQMLADRFKGEPA